MSSCERMKPTVILFFTCFNVRSIQLESSIYYFQKKGYKVLFLTTCERGPLHKALEENGIHTDTIQISDSPRALYYPRAMRFLVRYCREQGVDFVHSHLQVPNLISSLASRRMKAVVFNVRHNSDVVMLSGTAKEKWVDRIVNTFGKHIIAISPKVKKHLIEREGVDPQKIHRINNGYDFGQYNALSESREAYRRIREAYPCELLVVSPGRLTNTKRHDATVKAMKVMRQKGLSVKLLILGDGPELRKLQALIRENSLDDVVFLLGYHEQIADFLKAADAVALLSVSEASNNVVKEAGYFEKPVIVCQDVGDFEDYIRDDVNGWLVSKTDPVPGFIARIEKLYHNKQAFDHLGKALKETVLKEFDITSVGEQYEALQQQLRPNPYHH